MSISTVSAVRSAVTRRAGMLITRGDRHVHREARCHYALPQVAVGEDAEFAVGHPDQGIGTWCSVILMTASRTESSGDTSSTSPCTISPTGLVSATGTSAGLVAWRRIPRRRRQERQARRFGELSPHLLAGQPKQRARLGGARHELHAAAGEQRRVAEDAARLDGVDLRAVGAGLQRDVSCADHPDVVGHVDGVVGDHRVGGETPPTPTRPPARRARRATSPERACARPGTLG